MKLLLLLFLTGISIVGCQRMGGLNCAPGPDGSLRIACPKKSRKTGKAVCLTEAQFCNGVADCKGGDDEKEDKCRFWRDTIQQHKAISGQGRSFPMADLLQETYLPQPRNAITDMCDKCGWYCDLNAGERRRAGDATVTCLGVDCRLCYVDTSKYPIGY